MTRFNTEAKGYKSFGLMQVLGSTRYRVLEFSADALKISTNYSAFA